MKSIRGLIYSLAYLISLTQMTNGILSGIAVESVDFRIVNGDAVNQSQLSYFVAGFVRLDINSGLFRPECTGAILTKRHVITAAHCLQGSSRNDANHYKTLKVIAGIYLTQDGDKMDIKDALVHPLYKPDSLDKYEKYENDLGIAYLSQDVQSFASHYKVAFLSLASFINYAQRGSNLSPFYGWGQTYKKVYANQLHTMNFTILKEGVCTFTINATEGQQMGATKALFCGTSYGRQAITCPGDDGGPLVIPNSANTDVVVLTGLQVGEFSLCPGVNPKCSLRSSYLYSAFTAFVSIPFHSDWLQKNIGLAGRELDASSDAHSLHKIEIMALFCVFLRFLTIIGKQNHKL